MTTPLGTCLPGQVGVTGGTPKEEDGTDDSKIDSGGEGLEGVKDQYLAVKKVDNMVLGKTLRSFR